jgi:hypothetical protein
VKPNVNSVEVHPQLSNNGHPLDGVLVGARLLWLCTMSKGILYMAFRQMSVLRDPL